MGKEYELMIALEVARKRFALIIKALDRHDVFTEKSYQAVEPATVATKTGDDSAVAIEK